MVERLQGSNTRSRCVSVLLIRSPHAGPSYLLKMKACYTVGEKMQSSLSFCGVKDSKHQLAVLNENCQLRSLKIAFYAV